MFLGKVIGSVWSTVKWKEIENLKLLIIRPYRLKELEGGAAQIKATEAVVAADVLGAGVGEDVIEAYGHAARVGIEDVPPGAKPSIPIDSAVVAIVDKYEVKR